MTIIGNIFLGLAALIFFLIVSTLLLKEPARGGDAGVGYGWGIILFNLAFLGCMALVAIAIGWKGGFAWVASSSGARFLLVLLGLFAAVFTAALSLLFKDEPGASAVIVKVFSGFAPALLPLLLLVGSAVLLNDGLRESVPAAAYKWPLTAAFCIGVLGLGAAVIGWIVQSNQDAVRRMEGAISDQARYHQSHLDDIDSCDVTKNMVFILVFTDANHDADVREHALAKIKTRPDWQQEMIRLLECDWAPEAFTFLASNEVEDKSLFAEPVRQGVFNQARLIRQSIQDASQQHHLYPDQFSWQIERVLRTVEKFEGNGTDYLSAVREVRAAFDEPWVFNKPKFICIPVLDSWIKKRQ